MSREVHDCICPFVKASSKSHSTPQKSRGRKSSAASVESFMKKRRIVKGIDLRRAETTHKIDKVLAKNLQYRHHMKAIQKLRNLDDVGEIDIMVYGEVRGWAF